MNALKIATAITAATTVALIALTGAAHAEYVKAKPGNEVARVEAYCNMVASGAQRGYVAFGSSSYVAGAALGNAIGNMIAISAAKQNCMTMNGYEWKKPAHTKLGFATRTGSNKARNGLANE